MKTSQEVKEILDDKTKTIKEKVKEIFSDLVKPKK